MQLAHVAVLGYGRRQIRPVHQATLCPLPQEILPAGRVQITHIVTYPLVSGTYLSGLFGSLYCPGGKKRQHAASFGVEELTAHTCDPFEISM